MARPTRIESGFHKGKIYCTQYACKNNYGMQRGIICESSFPSGCCKLENPKLCQWDNEIWGCSDERYDNEVVINNKKVPKECYEEFGQDLDGCSTQENEGCGRCPLYK